MGKFKTDVSSETNVSKVPRMTFIQNCKTLVLKVATGAREMAQQLRTLAALPDVLSSIPSKRLVAHNHLYWDLMPSSGINVHKQIEHSYNKQTAGNNTNMSCAQIYMTTN